MNTLKNKISPINCIPILTAEVERLMLWIESWINSAIGLDKNNVPWVFSNEYNVYNLIYINFLNLCVLVINGY